MILDFTALDTTPGTEGPFAPPLTVQSDDDYRLWVCHQFHRCPAFRQYLAIAAQGINRPATAAVVTPKLKGPHARVLREACTMVSDTSGDTTPASGAITAPPTEMEDAAMYNGWLRQRFSSDARFRLQLETLADRYQRWSPIFRCSGPFKTKLEESLARVAAKSTTTTAA